MTPHNEALIGDFAETVLLPGDPLRAQWIAETFLEDVRCVNRVRGALGFTGTYRSLPVSLQATGMGRPSLAIYLHELVKVYGARILIRIGSCGALTAGLPLRSVFVADSAVMDCDLGSEPDRPDSALYAATIAAARNQRIECLTGGLVSSDVFYHPTPTTRFDAARAAGIRAVDMETAALFSLARSLGVRALSICTIVDNLLTGEEAALSERQELFRDMARLALEVSASVERSG